jgi:hypothetical protein
MGDQSTRLDACYEIRVAAPLAADKLRGLSDVVGAEDVHLRTVRRASFPDQVALHAFLLRLRGCGTDVVEVRRTGNSDGTDSSPTPCPGDA